MLLRFLTPSSGQIKVDGIELHQFDLGYLRRKIALVDQMPQLISASVAENIAFSTLDEEPINAQAVTEAAQKAGALDFIQQMENQFSEELAIGSDHDLSGGQKQRLSIARAFYKDAPIMLFDEPTSALDEASRNQVAETIKSIHGKTVILVTHDLNILSAVDKIFVLQDHKIVPVEELGGLTKYRKKLAAEEGDDFGVLADEEPADIAHVVEQPKVDNAAPAEYVPIQPTPLPVQPATVTRRDPIVQETPKKLADDTIEISLH
jgi:ABC-type bacteriocin/lantibiotic exporter with double-glycine peptidase domain